MARSAQAPGDENQSGSPNPIWKQLPLSQMGQFQFQLSGPTRGATVPAETHLLQPGMGQPLMSLSLGTKNSFHLDAKGGNEKTEPYRNQTISFALPFLKKYRDTQREQAQLGVAGTPVHCSWA